MNESEDSTQARWAEVFADFERWKERRKQIFYPKSDIDFDPAAMFRRKAEVGIAAASWIPEILPQAEKIEFLPDAGTLHALFRVQTTLGERLIVKVALQEPEWGFSVEGWALRQIRMIGLPTPGEFANQQELPFTSFIGSRPIPPFLIIDESLGKPLKQLENPETQALPTALLSALGLCVARAHTIKGTDAGLLDPDPRRVPEGVPENSPLGLHPTWHKYLNVQLENHLQVCHDIGAINESEQEIATKYFTAADSILNSVPSRLLHGDLGHHNIFSDGQNITAIIDWEDALVGDPVFDIAYWGTFVRDEMRAPFLEGYQSQEKLPSDFEYRYWLYYLRIALSKTIHRHRFGTKDQPGRPPASQRIQKALSNLAKL